MIFIYNLLQILLSPLIFAILFVGLYKKKNRKKIPQRLGLNLPRRDTQQKTIWVHALSVGEINSSLPLVKSLRESFSNYRIVVSASTVAGKNRAEQILPLYADHIIGAPFDFLPVIAYYLYRIKPSIYIQVETDFWPNILFSLKQRSISRILVNGRISKKSMQSYRRFSFFFQPLFSTYNILSMQTTADVLALQSLGIPKNKTAHLGNLKFAHQIVPPQLTIPEFYKKSCKGKKVIVAGSTHPGEEEILCAAFAQINTLHKDSLFFIAPRNIERNTEISEIATKYGLTSSCRSHNITQPATIHIIDTIGELMQFYSLADICIVGGSLIDFGGHNPIEPASLGKPVVFGPYMASFEEVAPLLTDAGAALQTSHTCLQKSLQQLLENSEEREEMARLAQKTVLSEQQGILVAHIDTIREHLNGCTATR